jgi:hypothetical protein
MKKLDRRLQVMFITLTLYLLFRLISNYEFFQVGLCVDDNTCFDRLHSNP